VAFTATPSIATEKTLEKVFAKLTILSFPVEYERVNDGKSCYDLNIVTNPSKRDHLKAMFDHVDSVYEHHPIRMFLTLE
jgi:hypothetical protein